VPINRQKLVIKKYENRRLYDTTNSRYINLDEVAQLVKEGREVEVLDAATGEDLTRLVLTQIIVEHAKEPDSVFPVDVLRQMIVASGRATQEGALNYMKTVFDIYQNAYRAIAPPLTPFDFIRGSAPSREEGFPGFGPPSASGPARQPGKGPAEVDELRQRIEELESRVSRSGPRKTNSARKGRSRGKS
jgi:polyhydroxyalkanoate synthesis repressor PhaR